ncbi:MAG TPA: twin-arginine translocase TatA/TatE family subunit [Verrucomicrobiales bacterium]|nr:twin-arginine translocase TatA/TatE family subunit [Verrucomicrobiales bacterium]
MNTLTFAMLGYTEVLLILAVVLILFGAKKIPELAKGLGSGIKEFKKATRDVQEDLQRAIEDDDTSAPPRRNQPSGQSVPKSSGKAETAGATQD